MLWIWYCHGTDEQIREACSAALCELARRGYTPHEAQRATFDAADHDDDGVDQTSNADAVVAWFSAEDLAFQSIFAATGEWPHGAALVTTSGGENEF